MTIVITMSDSSDGEDPFSTQDLKGIFTNIRDKYGHLGKKEFCNNLTSEYSEDDLAIFRQGLYDHALKNVPNTPTANLVVRKDTSHKSGGMSLDYKLSEDAYNLFHYIMGDHTYDICKVFSDKDKVRLRKETVCRSEDNITQTMDTKNTDEAKSDFDLPKTFTDFCRAFLVEMKTDRELLIKDIKEIKNDTAQIRELRIEMTGMKSDISEMKRRVDILEGQVKAKQRQLDNTRETSGHLQNEMTHLRSVVNERLTPLRSDIGTMVQRLNVLELTKAKSYADILSSPGSAPVGGERPDIFEGSPDLSKNRAPSIVLDAMDNTDKKLVVNTADSDQTFPKQRVVDGDTDLREDKEDSPDKTVSDPPKPLVLEGFIPRERRPKLDAIYVSGITTKGSPDDIAAMLDEYITKQGQYVRSAKVVKQKGNTMAVKVVVRSNEIDRLLDGDYWPSGLNIRKWINRDKPLL